MAGFVDLFMSHPERADRNMVIGIAWVPGLGLPTTESWGNMATLSRHFADHGPDFASLSEGAYVHEASAFLQRAMTEGLPTKIDSSGVIRVYDPNSNTFGAFNANGTTRTLFTPARQAAYWRDQPGVEPWLPGGVPWTPGSAP
jgi:pyocin large subunit-like protein